MTPEALQSTDWLAPGEKMFHALFEGSSLDLESTKELIVVPDGIVWYVPLAALPFKREGRMVPLISLSTLRVVPTLGLALGSEAPWRRVQRSGFAGGEIDTEEQRAEALAALRAAVPNPIDVPSPAPIPTPQMVPLLETLIVLNPIDLDPARPLAWSPVGRGRSSKQGSLSNWLTLPQFGPQRVLLPAVHTSVALRKPWPGMSFFWQAVR